MTHTGPPRTRPAILVAMAAVALIALGGCASAPAEAGGTTGTPSAGTEQGVKFAGCMRENGVADFPDPDATGQFQYGVSVAPDVWQKAVDACKDLQPPGTLSSDRSPEEQEAALGFAACMRENGVPDFPDPVDGEPLINTYKIPSSQKSGGMAILNAAIKKCDDRRNKAAGQ